MAFLQKLKVQQATKNTLRYFPHREENTDVLRLETSTSCAISV